MGRVVHLADYGGPYPGSFVPMLEATRTAVEGAQRDWTFEAVFTPVVERWPWYSALEATGARTRVAPRMSTRAAVSWLRSLLGEASGPTLLHTHFSAWDVPAALAAVAHRDVKVVWHVHTPLHDELSIRTTNMVKFGIIGQAVDRILLVGPEIQEQVRRRLAPRRRMSLFPNGIDFGRFVVPDAQARASARARLGLPIDLPLLVTFAWDWDRKGGPLFLEAIRLLRSRGLRVVGVPVVLDERAAELAQDEGVRPLTPIDDVSDLYAAADVFVAASDAEGMPFSVLEALASGTPVVASDIPSHRFFGDDLPTLRLVQRSPPALAAAIASEIQEEATRQARAASTRTQLQTRFSLSRWADRLVQVYTELMAPEPYLPDRGARAGAREG